MCGIHGFLGVDKSRLFRMVGSASHRGVDGVGMFTDDQISLGQNLLAIMDVVDQSRQPWRLEHSKAVLCFNGQVYNFLALAKELGATMRTRCDTEVLALGLEAEGERFLEKIDGMYALSFYDARKGELLIARDAAGLKPLYYEEGGAHKLSFSSELRGLMQRRESLQLDPLAASAYFQLGYVPGPRTLVAGIKKLTPGEWRRYRIEDGKLLASGATGRAMPQSCNFRPREFRAGVREAVQSCAQGLRPMGIYLSGGLDSSMIFHEAVGLGLSFSTYSARFVGRGLETFNEDADLARQLAAHYGVKHVDIEVNESDFVRTLHEIPDILEEPRYNRSSPAYLLTASKLAADGVVVTMAGDGGDEMLGGYPKYADSEMLRASGAFDVIDPTERSKLFERLRIAGAWRWPCSSELDLSRPIDRWYYLSKFRLEERGLCQGLRKPSTTPELLAYFNSWIGDDLDSIEPLNAQLYIDQLTWLPEDALIRNDKIGMSFGMEGRFPLVTRSFRNYAMGLSTESKILNGKLKRAAAWAYENVLPDFIAKRRRKSGWAAPVLQWQSHKGALSDELDATFQDGHEFSSFLDLEGIRGSNEPKLIYSATNLILWAQHAGVSPPG